MKLRYLLLTFLLVSCAEDSQDAGRNDIWLQNLSLAREGRLAEDAFTLNQDGIVGLFPAWNKDEESSVDVAQIYYEAGHIALAQRMAFEADVCRLDGHNSDMMRLLVKTNLIYGAWKPAEKYITFLEKEGTYRRWAKSQRRFLYNDAAVESDSEYGPKRKCIPDDFQCEYRGLVQDMEDIAATNPDHLNTLEYLGLYYLMQGDMPSIDSFVAMVRKYYGPKSGRAMPRSFAEACCMVTQYRNFWRNMGVSTEINKSYNNFIKAKDFGDSLDSYKNTYWYYYYIKLGNI